MTTQDAILAEYSFKIFLPDESCSKFRIFHDLAELFGEEYNEQALRRLKKLLAEHLLNPKGKLLMDHEADNVSLRASKAEVISLVAQIINENSIELYKRPYTEDDYARILKALSSWKRPKPKTWSVGDVFVFKLVDDTLGFGQVLAKEYDAPSCALFEVRSPHELPIEEIVKSRVISILHLGSDLLDKGVWRVLGNCPLIEKAKNAQHSPSNQVGVSYGGGWALDKLANAYFGLSPWNGDFMRETVFDDMLMPGVKRPENCWWLSKEGRCAYRSARGLPID